jgi:hypothetical protein
VLFDYGDADFKLEAFVDFVLLELGQLRVEAIDVALVAILLLISVISSATAAKPRSIFPSRSAKLRSTAERTLSSVTLLFFVWVFVAIYGEYSMAVVGGTNALMVWMPRITKIRENANFGSGIMRAGCSVHHGS